MDALLLEQHLRTPLRLFPEPLMPHFIPQDADGAQLLEKARQHLQMWGRSPYTELLLPQVYQRPGLSALNLGLWQGQWPPQLSAGFLQSAAASSSISSRTPPPSQQQQQQQQSSTSTTTSNSGSPSPDMRAKHFSRFSPYQTPSQQQQQHNHTQSSSSSSRSPQH